jgi:hypothetical protein
VVVGGGWPQWPKFLSLGYEDLFCRGWVIWGLLLSITMYVHLSQYVHHIDVTITARVLSSTSTLVYELINFEVSLNASRSFTHPL